MANTVRSANARPTAPVAVDGRTPALPRSTRMAMALAIAMPLIIGLAFLGWQYKRTYDDLRAAQGILRIHAETLNDEVLDLGPERVDALQFDFERASQRLESAQRRLDRDPLYALAGKLPWLGEQKKGMDSLLSIAGDLSAAGVAGSRTLKAAPATTGGSDGVGRQILELTRDHAGDLRTVQAASARALSERERLRERSLVGPLGGARDEFVRYGDRLREVHALASFGLLAPRALGQNEAQRYLVLGMDNSELMPGGGFIGDVAVLSVDAGRADLAWSMNVYDLYATWQARPDFRYVAPPEPLRRYLLGDQWSWAMGEASWYPDFPTTATTAQYFLRASGRDDVQATTGLTISAMEALLKVTGPIDVPQYGLTFTSSGLALQITAFHHAPDGSAKFEAFIEGLLSRLLSLDRSRWGELWRTVSDLAASEMLFMHFNDAELQRATVDLGWDGALPPPGSRDTLLLADSNVRASKLNLALRQSAQLDIDLSQQPARHRFTARYRNAFDEWTQGRDPKLFYAVAGETGVLGDYVQLFAPPTATLVNLQRTDASGRTMATRPEFQGPSLGHQTFATFLPIGIGEDQALMFEYATPARLQRANGRLVYEVSIQKQPGVPPYPFAVRAQPPAGYRATGATVCPRITSRCDAVNPAGFEFDLASDTVVRLEFSR